jgi:hypothetical protein
LKRLKGKLTYANVMATIAVFLVVGGGSAFAATQMLPKNSVGTTQIKNSAVTPAKLSSASKAALTGPKGATGPQGIQGIQGVPGVRGPSGANNLTVVQGPDVAGSEAHCPAGMVATGGGAQATGGFTEQFLTKSAPATFGAAATAWAAEAEDTEGNQVKVQAYVICATP